MARRATRGLGATFIIAWGVGCGGQDLRDDGFTRQIAPRCATAGGCEEALKEAQARLARCEKDPSIDGCPSAREDLASVERLNKRHVDESAARVARANPATKPEEPKTSAVVEAARGGIPLSEHAAAMRTALADCKATAQLARCSGEGASPEEKASCEAECTKFGAQRSEDLFRGQLRACAEGAVSDPKSTKCAADGRVWAPKERLDECSKKCAALGVKLRAYDSTHTKCCDGTRSPTCTNGAPGTACCAANGGVCQEPKPTE